MGSVGATYYVNFVKEIDELSVALPMRVASVRYNSALSAKFRPNFAMFVPSVRIEKKKNRNALSPNAEGVSEAPYAPRIERRRREEFHCKRVWVSAVSSPSGYRRSPAAQRHLVYFGLKICFIWHGPQGLL